MKRAGLTALTALGARTDRRTFLGVAAAALGAARVGALTRRAHGRLGRIGVQLYTIRDAMKADFEGSLARVAEIGYQEVEFAGYFDRTPRQVRTILDRNHLKAPSSHIPIEMLSNGWDRMLEDAHVMGHEYLVVAWINEPDRTVDGYKRVAELFNRAGEQARKAGIRFGYHNHAYEFDPVDGVRPYDILLAHTNPRDVAFELDLFWIVKGGADPLTCFATHEGRFPLVHVKDMDARGGMVDVGRGTIDFAGIFRHARQAGIKHYFVEHDEPADPFASIAASYRYLHALRF